MPSTKSLCRQAVQEADKHKYLESQKAGRDLGKAAIAQWYRQYCTPWLRYRWIEHLMGVEHYQELPDEKCGVLKRRHGGSPLLPEIVEKVSRGAENLDVCIWASGAGHDVAAVVSILIDFSVNCIRCMHSYLTFAMCF